jgi:ABC-type transport system substrate-binding protein
VHASPDLSRGHLTRRRVLRAVVEAGFGGALTSVLVSCGLVNGLLQAAPGQANAVAAPVGSPATAEARDGGTLHACFGTQDPLTLDPYLNTSFRGQTFAAFVYSRLLMSKKAAGVASNAYLMEGDLAESWQHSPDGLTYTFNLRRNATWAAAAPMNGRPVTAGDVTWSFGHFMQVSPQKSTFDIVADVSAPDDHTLVFRLKSAYAPFEALVGSPIFWIQATAWPLASFLHRQNRICTFRICSVPTARAIVPESTTRN